MAAQSVTHVGANEKNGLARAQITGAIVGVAPSAVSCGVVPACDIAEDTSTAVGAVTCIDSTPLIGVEGGARGISCPPGVVGDKHASADVGDEAAAGTLTAPGEVNGPWAAGAAGAGGVPGAMGAAWAGAQVPVGEIAGKAPVGAPGTGAGAIPGIGAMPGG
mmetsp:Transcript_109245/g.308154  ORF Transcript_109245/g.308154 Transcript_109245/m.308154 type:complete len:162 (-) Transcript_109245:920-1405(-)